MAVAGCAGDGEDGEDGTPAEGEGNETGTEDGEEQDVDVGENELSLINSTMSTLDPINATDTASGTVIQQLFDALTNYPNGETEVENLLAEEYEVSDDFTTYTFTLADATFHNGDDLTAEDFVYSFERLAGSPHSQRSYFILDSLGVAHETETVEQDGEEAEVYQSGSLAVEAVDENTLEIQLEEAFHSTLEMLAYTSFAAIPEGILGETPDEEATDEGEATDEYNEFANSDPVGTGPFEFDAWEQGTEARVTKFDDYHGEAADVEAVHWQIIEDEEAAYNFSMNKNADVFGIPSAQYDPEKISIDEEDDKGREFGTYGPLRNDEEANYMSTPQLLTYYVGFNMAEVPKEVRQAFAHVMDQDLMVEEVFKGRGKPAYHLTPPPIFPNEEYDSHAEENYPYGYGESQIDQAREIMEEAGYDENNTYEIQWTQYDSTTWEDMAKILRDQLEAAHIDMSIEKAPFSTLIERGHKGNLEAYTLGWIADWPEADNFLQLINPPQTDTSQEDAISYLNWSAETGEAAQQAADAYQQIDDNLAPTDDAAEARDEAALQMETANWEDVGFLNVYHGIGERFWYDWVEYPAFGGMGYSRQKYNRVSLSQRE